MAERAVYETIEEEEVDPVAQARQLAEKRSTQLGDLPADKKRRRLLAFLARRGFRGYEIDQMVREVLAADDAAADGAKAMEDGPAPPATFL